MSNWYVSSTNYAAVATFTASHVYALNDIIRPTSPSASAQYTYKCTTAGTSSSEPSWNTGDNATTSSGTATFTNVGGQAWSTPIGNLISITGNSAKNPALGDKIFVSSDHSETDTGGINLVMSFSQSFNSIKVLSVNKAGSVPPVAADLQSGAQVSGNNGYTFDTYCNMYWYGITFTNAAGNMNFSTSASRQNYFKDCALVFTGSSGGPVSGGPGKVVLDNTTLQVSNSASGQIRPGSSAPFEVEWINTPSAIGGATHPSSLFSDGSLEQLIATCRGVDLSAITGTLVSYSSGNIKALFEGCKINSSVTRYSAAANNMPAGDVVEFVNCYDGTNTFSERYTPTGKLTTDTSTYMTGGAADDVGNFSHKLVSNSQCDITTPCESFWLDVENTVTGSSKTATVEIVSSASLNNTDIKMQLEYMGTSGSPVTTFADSLATILTSASAVPSSSATWNSPPSTPVYQKLQITFTPQMAGRVRARVQLVKASTTVWVNPQIAIT
ncbi:hypothetical protein [Bradyrhizobium sp. USDA 4529]